VKKLFTLFAFFLLIHSIAFAAWGFFDSNRSDVTINLRGTTTSYTLWNAGAGTFTTADLGTINALSDAFQISVWNVRTYKNGGSDVTGCKLYWRVYLSGGSGGSFTGQDGNWQEDLGGGDQRWGKTGSPITLPTYLDPGKDYILEIYIEAYGTGPSETKYDSNGGANYKATFHTNAALPVELTSFTAVAKNGVVNLRWETATEVNNNGFEIQRKSEKDEWSKIGFVEGHFTTNSPKYYSFSDKPVGFGIYSYRLKQIDNDGKFEYSPVVEVLVDNLPNGFVLEQNYPNPFNPETAIKFALKEDTKATLKVYNVLGAEVATLFDGIAEAGRYYDLRFNGSEFPSGVYTYKLEAGNTVSVKKMLLLK